MSVVYVVRLRIFSKAALQNRGSMEPIEPPLDPPLVTSDWPSMRAGQICPPGKGRWLAQIVGSCTGPKCIDGLRNLVRVITFPLHALSAYPLCKEEDISSDSLLSHILTTHSRSPCNSDKLLPLLLSVPDSDSVLFNHLCSLANLF